jgi:hypothetical protein
MARAVWHTDVVVPELEDDPFAPTDVRLVGVPIVLAAGGEAAALSRAVAASLVLENTLYEQGQSCKIKDSPESSCFACPLFDAADSLCELGREQETLATRLLVLHHGGRR